MNLFGKLRKSLESGDDVMFALDFSDPDVVKFETSLSAWREHLEKNGCQTSLDQTSLKYLSPDAIKAMRREKRRRSRAKKASEGDEGGADISKRLNERKKRTH